MRFSKVQFFTTFCMVLTADIACSQSTEEDIFLSFGDEEFVSIATGQQQSLAKAPAVATVITAQQIEAMGATNLDEVLESVPGLHVSLSSLWFSPIYSMRGIHTDSNAQVLMLMNGTPLTQILLGDRGPRSTLPVSNIARVEVIRGPGSAVYGADAFAGVINIITKTAADIGGTQLGGRIGSFNTAELWLLHGSTLGEVDVTFNFDVFKTDGDDNRIINDDLQTLFDTQLGTDASLAPGSTSTDIKRADLGLSLAWRNLKFSMWHWRQNGGVGPGAAQALDPSGFGETNDYLFDLGYANDDTFDDWEIAAKLSYMDINHKAENTLFPAGALLPLGCDGNINPLPQVCDDQPGGLPFRFGYFTEGLIGNAGSNEEYVRLDASTFYNGFKAHTVRMGAGYIYAQFHAQEQKNYGPGITFPPLEVPCPIGSVPFCNVVDGDLTDVSGTEFVYLPEMNRSNYYGSLQDEWRFAADWELTLGVRYDHFSDFGSTVNPRAALVWNARQELTAKLLYGRAFRAPSFAELFSVNNPVVLGNPDLDPETINTYELVFAYRPILDVRTGLNLFYYEIDDLIQFVPDANDLGTRTARNNGGQKGRGFELEAEWHISPALALTGHYAFQQSEFEETGATVGKAPGQQLYGDFRWAFVADWEFSVIANWVGDRERDAGDPREPIDDYTWVNAVLRRKNIGNRVDLTLKIKNLLDADAFEPSPRDSGVTGDYPLEGRGVFLSASYRIH